MNCSYNNVKDKKVLLEIRVVATDVTSVIANGIENLIANEEAQIMDNLSAHGIAPIDEMTKHLDVTTIDDMTTTTHDNDVTVYHDITTIDDTMTETNDINSSPNGQINDEKSSFNEEHQELQRINEFSPIDKDEKDDNHKDDDARNPKNVT